VSFPEHPDTGGADPRRSRAQSSLLPGTLCACASLRHAERDVGALWVPIHAPVSRCPQLARTIAQQAIQLPGKHRGAAASPQRFAHPVRGGSVQRRARHPRHRHPAAAASHRERRAGVYGLAKTRLSPADPWLRPRSQGSAPQSPSPPPVARRSVARSDGGERPWRASRRI
jgi:hypothetical protein